MSDTRRQQRIPSYRLHKPTGRAVVTLDGRDHYLGEHGSPPSQARYDRLVREYLENGRTLPGPRDDKVYQVGDLCRDFVRWAKHEYRMPDGREGGGVGNVRVALRPLGAMFMDVPLDEFGPHALQLFRAELIVQGNARKTINAKVNMVRRAVKWAVRNELISPTVLHGLQSVDGLKRGRCGVRESPGRGPAPDLAVDKALAHMPVLVRAMAELQLLTGMRPGEVVVLRPCDIDRAGAVWLYRPIEHKNAWREHDRIIPIGPKGQEILRPLLRPGYQERFLFSPQESERLRREARRANRQTPLWPSHVRAQARKRQAEPKCGPGERYATTTYARAIARACKAAGVPCWTPGQLRHNAATRARKEFGLEAAAAMLGHRLVETTQIYADVRDARAVEVANAIG
jgi:integrase